LKYPIYEIFSIEDLKIPYKKKRGTCCAAFKQGQRIIYPVQVRSVLLIAMKGSNAAELIQRNKPIIISGTNKLPRNCPQ
jgi:hypothetical protein